MNDIVCEMFDSSFCVGCYVFENMGFMEYEVVMVEEVFYYYDCDVVWEFVFLWCEDILGL